MLHLPRNLNLNFSRKLHKNMNLIGTLLLKKLISLNRMKIFLSVLLSSFISFLPTSSNCIPSLQDGPKHFGGGSKLPLQEEEQDKGIRLTMLPLPRPEDQSDSDESLDFLEVPNVLMRSTPENAPEAVKPATYEHTSLNMPFDS